MNTNTNSKNKTIFWLLSISLIVLDQISKYFIREKLSEGIKLNSFFSIEFIQNTGAGFGILKGQQLLLILVSVLVIGGVLFYLRKIIEDRNLTIALSLIFAGGIGNLIDRIFFGFVTDFLAFSFWPAFNVADTAISLGAILLFIYVLKEERNSKSNK